MISSLLLITSGGYDPYRNLALEEYLLGKVAPGTCILYLWQNENTVVIGRNQSALEECNLQALAANGGRLARRLSGGGAVYHDLGNQNFTFLMPSDDFDKARQTEVICRAMRLLGLDAQISGRNDLTIDGRKFSGHAYYHSRANLGDASIKCSCHHGTVMVNVDGDALGRYLNVNPLKLKAKGVKSVKSRVANLVDFRPETSCGEVRSALKQAFGDVYQLTPVPLVLTEGDWAAVNEMAARYASKKWLLHDEEPLDHSASGRFDWGTSRLDWSEESGLISKAALWSDGLDADELEEIPRLLVGVQLDGGDLAQRLEQAGISQEIAPDLTSLLLSHTRPDVTPA